MPFLCPQLFNIGVDVVDVDSEGGDYGVEDVEFGVECVLDVGEDSCQIAGMHCAVEVLEDTVPVSAGGRRERELVGAAAVGLGLGLGLGLG